MKIFNYHPISGFLIGESVADESPLEEGVFLVPAFSTDLTPPDPIEGKIIVFSEEAWHYVDEAVEAPPVVEAPTQEMVIAAYSAAVQSHLDAAARSAGYDNINTAVSYAEEPAVVKFQVEGAAFRVWRSLCWAYCYAQLAAVEAQEREQPTIEALIAELPSLVLP